MSGGLNFNLKTPAVQPSIQQNAKWRCGMTLQLYLGVEGVLLRRTGPDSAGKSGFEPLPYALDFLEWAVLEFDCHWLTRLDRLGGFEEVKRAFKVTLDLPERSGELDLLFHLVQPTYWETCKVEAIDLDRDFIWIDDDPDEESLAVLKRRSLMDRLMICRKPDDLVKIRCQLEPIEIDPGAW
jgi:hypothetical protein